MIILKGESEVLNVNLKFLTELVKHKKNHNFSRTNPDIPDLLKHAETHARQKAQLEQLELLKSEIEMYNQFRWVGVICGLALMLSGFTLWYYRVQRYQDRLLKKEATKTD